MLACWAFAEWLHWQQVGMPTRSISLCTFRLHSPQRLGQHTALISDTSDAVMSEIFGGRGVVALLRMPPVLSGLVVALLRMPPVLSGRRRTPPHATCVVLLSSHSSACHLCCLLVVALLRMPPVLSGLVVVLLRMPPVLSGRRHHACTSYRPCHLRRRRHRVRGNTRH